MGNWTDKGDQMRLGDELPPEVDAELALRLSLKVDRRTIAAHLRILGNGNDSMHHYVRRMYPDIGTGSLMETMRYVLENRTVVDAGAYRNGWASGVAEVAEALGLPPTSSVAEIAAAVTPGLAPAAL